MCIYWLNYVWLWCHFNPSTVSSSINALAAVTVEDLIKPYTNMSEKHLSWISKGLSEWIVHVYSISSGQIVCWTLIHLGGNYRLNSLLFAGFAYGALCIGMAGLASLMGGILQVKRRSVCFIVLHSLHRMIIIIIIGISHWSDTCFFIQAAVSIFGVIGGPLLGLFTLGILCPFANSKVSLFSYIWILIQLCKSI